VRFVVNDILAVDRGIRIERKKDQGSV